MTTRPSEELADADLVSALLSIDPKGLGGVWVRARHGPQRDRLEKALARIPLSRARISPGVDDLAIFGGLDLSESLLTGRPMERAGCLDTADSVWLTGVQGMDAGRQTRIGNRAEGNTVLILLDEGAEDDPLPHQTLVDRCAFFLDETSGPQRGDWDLGDAQERYSEMTLTDDQSLALASTAMMGGIVSMRPLLFAGRAARALAALDRCESVETGHLATASRLVFGHRALGPMETEAPPEQPPENDRSESEPDNGDCDIRDDLEIPQDVLIEAMQTALPGNVLAELVSRGQTTSGTGQGDEKTSLHRGRPLPSRPGRLDGRGRPDILATLSAAAPYQRLRGAQEGQLAIRPEDIRIRRFREQSERLILFVVDASGSAAMSRLAEGKGAVEILLSRAYSERDFVSMIVFRDMGAEMALPPTRALARAKGALTGLRAGGATPLAAGLKLALETALQARRKGQTPHVVLISDGRANRTLEGLGDRSLASDEATAMARHLRASGVPVTLLDTGRRPSRELASLADTFACSVIELPRRMNAQSGEAIADVLAPQH